MRILMVGLDAAGKTTILYKLKLGEGRSFVYTHRGAFFQWRPTRAGTHLCVSKLALLHVESHKKMSCFACCFFFYLNPQVVTTIPTIGKLPLMVRPTWALAALSPHRFRFTVWWWPRIYTQHQTYFECVIILFSQDSTSRLLSTRTFLSPCGMSEVRTRSALFGVTITKIRRVSSSLWIRTTPTVSMPPETSCTEC